MIRNSDGTPYQVSGTLNIFNPANTEERSLLNQFDSEIIRINGTPLCYYEFLADASSINNLYFEARSALFDQNPITLYAYYDPITSQNYQDMFGIDSRNMMTFELNYDATVAAIGHLPVVGSRLYSPHRGENWVIIQKGAGDWKLWGQIRLLLECQQFQETSTRGEGKVTQPRDGYKIN
jgi:hypothetical protein